MRQNNVMKKEFPKFICYNLIRLSCQIFRSISYRKWHRFDAAFSSLVARGCDAPPKSVKRSTFCNKVGQKWGFCRRVKGVRFKKVHFWVQKVHFFGILHLPKINPGYGPEHFRIGWTLNTISPLNQVTLSIYLNYKKDGVATKVNPKSGKDQPKCPVHQYLWKCYGLTTSNVHKTNKKLHLLQKQINKQTKTPTDSHMGPLQQFFDAAF